MSKPFIQISKLDFHNLTKTITVTLAGITFTFFGMNINNNTSQNFVSEITTVNVFTECSSVEADGIVMLMNEVDVNKKIAQAFDDLCHAIPDANNLTNIYNFMATGLNSINSEKVSVDCNTETGLLNVAFRLPDGAILSVTKCNDTMTDDLVAFNIIKQRKLIISDIIGISELRDYILNVQRRMA